MLTAQKVLPTKVGVAPGTTTFTLGDPFLCDRGPKAAVQAMRFYPTLFRRLGAKLQEAAACVAPAVVPMPTKDAPTFTTVVPAEATTIPDPANTRSPKTTTKPDPLTPYETMESLKGIRGFFARWRARRAAVNGLGYILNVGPTANGQPTSEIVATRKNYGPNAYCGTYDRLYHTRATPGFYYDGRGLNGTLGAIPTDLQLSRIRGYTPVMSSWIPFVGGTWAPPPWVPPNGTWTPDGIRRMGPMISRLQMPLAGPMGEEIPAVDPATAAVAELKRHQDRVFALSVVSTMAIASTAVINLLKHFEDSRRSRKRGTDLEPASPTTPVAGWFGRRRRSRR